MYPSAGQTNSAIDSHRPLEPGQIQFIERNFGSYLEGDQSGHRLRQIHRWLFVEGKPVSIVRQRLAASVRRARVLAITSGKGGVGKTTISVNLAVALAQIGWRVLLFDADLGMANTHIFAGVQPRGTLLDVVERRATLSGIATPGPEGIQLVCGASGIADLANLDAPALTQLSRELTQLAESFDLLMLDTGAGISSQVMHFLGLAQDLIVVTTPNLAATLDAYGVVKAAHDGGLSGKIRLLVNQVCDAQEASAVSGRIAGCAQRFLGHAPEVLGYLTREAAVEQANQQRRPLHLSAPGSENVARLGEIAVRLCGLPAAGRRSEMKARVTPPASPGGLTNFSTAAV